MGKTSVTAEPVAESVGSRILERLGIVGMRTVEPVILAALIQQDPMLLIGPHGTGKSYLLNRLAASLQLQHRHYNASLLNFDDLVGYPLPNGSGGLDYIQTPAHRQDVALPPRSAEQTGVNLKRAKEITTTKLIISGGKLAEPSAPFSLDVEEFLDEQFGLGRSASPALHLELGWVEEQITQLTNF